MHGWRRVVLPAEVLEGPDGDAVLGAPQQPACDGSPSTMLAASGRQLRGGIPGWRKSLRVDDHQFFAPGGIREMDQPDVHEVTAPIPMRSQEGMQVCFVRARLGRPGGRCNPRIDVEIETANRGVPRRVVRVMQLRVARKIRFELDPVELANAPAGIGADKRVQLAFVKLAEVPDSEYESVGSNVTSGPWQSDLHRGIAARDHRCVRYRSSRLRRAQGR